MCCKRYDWPQSLHRNTPEKQFARLTRHFDLVEVRHKSFSPMGTWDATRVDDQGNGETFQLVTGLPHPKGIDERFGMRLGLPHWIRLTRPAKDLFVIDTGMPHVHAHWHCWVVEWFKLRRHFNCDVIGHAKF
jgi:hypothetical protein